MRKLITMAIASAALCIPSVAMSQMPTSAPVLNILMAKKPSMEMSAADMNMMMSCKQMSNTVMMKNERCSDMMKMHPNMMKMSSEDMRKMSSCMKMSDKKMMADERCSTLMRTHRDEMMVR